jgi:putative methionine-R-sulfoxide reductase with GAF domain
MKSQDKEKQEKKLALDEHTFQQLLESAHVIQQFNGQAEKALQASSDPLAEIVETQKIIESRKLDLTEASLLIAGRTLEMVRASGVVIATVQDNDVLVAAASGNAGVSVGDKILVEKSVAAPVLSPKSSLFGKILLCPDVSAAPELNAELCRGTGIRSLVLVPVQYDGKIGGVLQIHSDELTAFDEQDVRRAELMASLFREAIARSADQKRNVGLAPTPASPVDETPRYERAKARELASDTSGASFGEEVPTAEFSASSFDADSDDHFSSSRFKYEKSDKSSVGKAQPAEIEAILAQVGNEAQAKAGQDSITPWTSATSAREWLDTVADVQSDPSWISRQWRDNRANFYLAISALLLLAVISGWGTRASGPATSSPVTVAKAQPLKVQLTLFEKSLIALGLADAPVVPPNLGNPSARVWIDLHTALYYCPGAPMYGKTPGGKYSLQRDAQLDQFEPADRKVCE